MNHRRNGSCSGSLIPDRDLFRGTGLWCMSSVLLFLNIGFTHHANAAERLDLEILENGGLARGGYPVHAMLKFPRPVPPNTGFRLLDGKIPVVAQFRPDRQANGSQWWLDFQTEIKPHEKKRYVVEFGDDVPAGPERPQGHKLTRTDQGFAIANAPYITWNVPHDLKGLLQSVDFPPAEFLRDDSPGLMLRDRRNREYRFAGEGQALREGPMAVALRFENTESEEQLADVRSIVDLTFPAPVSWVEVEWRIDDRLDNVAAVGLQLNLKLEESQLSATLVDFGATSVVYTSLYPGQSAELLAEPLTKSVLSQDSPLWTILRRDPTHEALFAVGRKGASAEGWAHLMDRKICLAVAMEAFARETRDRITATADGNLHIWREFDPDLNGVQKRLRLWLHFVHFPPQATAGASPQQMQSPLEVEWLQP